MVLTKNRAKLLEQALASIAAQTFTDFEVVLVNDGSIDETEQVIESFKQFNILAIKHNQSLGINKSRQEALLRSGGEFIAPLDDDDEWIDNKKLEKQLSFFQSHPKTVLLGGGVDIWIEETFKGPKLRPSTDSGIRSSILLKNNFFTSTVMFRREAALEVGGFVDDGINLAEDYDLWLRLGTVGKLANLPGVFAKHRKSAYPKEKFRLFLKKQLALITKYQKDYPNYWLASIVLNLRLWLGL